MSSHKLTVLNIFAAVAVLFGVAYGLADMRHAQLCINRGVTIVDAYYHGVPAKTTEAVVNRFLEEC